MTERRKYKKHPVQNLKIRGLIAESGITYKELAQTMFISQSALSMWFMQPLAVWQKNEVLDAIDKIKAERERNEKED